jgi:polysaccharide export outer membrane protein
MSKMHRFLFLLSVVFVAMISLHSCTVNKEFMFKEPKEFVFDKPNFDSTNFAYRIGPNDFLTMDIYTNEGALIVQYTTSAEEYTRTLASPALTYIVDVDGYVELPTLGKVKLSGMTITEAQDFLENAYSFQFNKPYCMIRVINKRVVLFNGTGGTGIVIPLLNQNVSLIEAIALGGGLAERAHAGKIKLFRKVSGKTEIYHIDLSTIEGIRYADFAVQSGDIIYVESVPRRPNEVVKQAQPFLTAMTTFFVLYRFFKTI